LRSIFLRRVERRARSTGAEIIDSSLLEAGEVLQDTYEALRPIQETPLAEVREALDRLPLPYREPLVLAHVGGFAYREIAEILAIPLGTVMSRLFRARRLLRSELREPTRRARST
jgi:RNA polymerase sigma-70 factor, ECF subfamily